LKTLRKTEKQKSMIKMGRWFNSVEDIGMYSALASLGIFGIYMIYEGIKQGNSIQSGAGTLLSILSGYAAGRHIVNTHAINFYKEQREANRVKFNVSETLDDELRRTD